jgi:hypothetical protein
MAKKTVNQEMKIKTRKISDLIRAEYNPRELTKEQQNQLTDSLKRFGLVDPIIVNTHKDRKNILVGGHQRMKVWESMGNETIPTVEVNLNLEKEKELNVRLNKNTGQFDMELIQEHFETDDLIEWGFDANEFIKDESNIEDAEEGEELNIPQSLQVIPGMEYVLIIANKENGEWDELQLLLKLKKVRSGGCKIGSTSDKVGMGTERVLSLEDIKKRLNL